MKTQELRKKDTKELQKTVQELKKKLSDARFTAAANQTKNAHEIRATRKEVARILTVINELTNR